MFGSKMKLTSVLGTAFVVALSLGLADRAAAAPPPGMRWSDHAWGSSSRPPTDLKGYGLQQWMNSHRGSAQSRGQPTRVGPAYTAPRSYSYSPPVAYAPAPAAAPAPATVTIRGTDGTLRTFPIEGSGVVQQQVVPGHGAPGFVSVRDADGVVRSYPVVTTTSPAATPAIAAPVPTGSCR